ncbi:MAG: guanine deaminase-like protein [Olpidium bornovanus]|uniref:Guanine deaminase-like protein n=1 Tax=Olpidium bornovanus TaxID=278681 RepID=A0A8H7ZTD3_9FUNG|nr:MAG: guanine deaminase-like protein [Olpidium bornovanus]
MLDAVRSAATAAKVVQMTERRDEGGGGAAAYAALTLAELVYLATLGGARVLGLPVGNFEPGMEFDALLVDLAAPAGPVDTFPEEDTLEEMLEKFLFLGDDRNIRRVWVRGNVVKDSAGDVRLSAAAAAGPVVR